MDRAQQSDDHQHAETGSASRGAIARPSVGVNLKHELTAFMRSEVGATAIEYGMIASLIFLAIVASVKVMATNTVGMWTKVGVAVDTSTTP